jgi:protocatechuate 3,4-dioxygenase beta subunit
MNPAEIDPNFTGWANITTGPDGRYHLRSTKPGPYPTSTPGWWRPPHIHFQVTTAQDRMVTQMYLPNEKLNRQDELLARHVRLNQDDRVMARLHNLEGSMEADAISIEFNIILPTPRTIASQRTVRAKE